MDKTNPKRGRPKTRLIPIRLSQKQQKIVRVFLSFRLSQAIGGLAKFDKHPVLSDYDWTKKQREHMEKEIGVIRRLIATVGHKVGYKKPD